MELLEIAAQLAQILTVVSIVIAIRSNTQLNRKQWNGENSPNINLVGSRLPLKLHFIKIN
jgi:hypothetical protein